MTGNKGDLVETIKDPSKLSKKNKRLDHIKSNMKRNIQLRRLYNQQAKNPQTTK